MIISLDNKKPALSRKKNWKNQFRSQLYTRNRTLIDHHTKSSQNRTIRMARECAGDRLSKAMQQCQSVTIVDPISLDGCYSYYSSFIPLQMQTKFDNELDHTFPFFKHLEQTGKNNDRHLFYIEISEYIKNCKNESSIMDGWKNCLRKFLCGLDVVRAIEVYLEVKKRGTVILPKLYQQFGRGCNEAVFFHRVSSAARYFTQSACPLLMPFSIQAGEQINETTMPKTMKMLFCSICLIYDCGQHSLDDHVKGKEFKYVSPKNIVSQQKKLKQALSLCGMFKQLKMSDKIDQGTPCQNQCYRKLERRGWEEIQSKKRGTMMSPVVKGVVKLSIQMFGYNPCKIWKMLIGCTPQKDKNSITCSMVFKFLVDQYNLLSRLERKLCLSQEELLRRETKGEAKEAVAKKNKKKIKIAHQTASQYLSTCGHYFVGEQPWDPVCEDCSCRQRGFCMPQCLCGSNCPIRKIGCRCKKEGCGKKCPCAILKQECDPLLCQGCYREQTKCRNKGITEGRFKKVKIGRSTIPGAGLGLFAGQEILKDELVQIYAGELIDQSIDLLRECLSVDLSFYNFGSPEGTIDARFMGNISRFINHGNVGENENLRSENILSNGRYKIAFYALRDISIGQQLFFNYDGEGELYKNYRDKYPFIKSSKKPAK